MGIFDSLKRGLSKTREVLSESFDVLTGNFLEIDDDFYEELEELLIMSDVGINTTEEILDNLQERVIHNHVKDPKECKRYLVQTVAELMGGDEIEYKFENERSVILVIGVNGVGKTTTVAKLASKLKDMNKSVLISAADTFRAAAGTQLKKWADKLSLDMIGGAEGADPGSVLFDSLSSFNSKGNDICIVDTAGRLHNKKNLMDELHKLNSIIDKTCPGVHKETLLVLDGATGQNALSQAKEFAEVTDITGIVLTKLDGSGKGGVAIGICAELNVPVKYIGVGESADDLIKFNPKEYLGAIFGEV